MGKGARRARKVFRFVRRRCSGRVNEAARTARSALRNIDFQSVGQDARAPKFAKRAGIWNYLQWVRRLLKKNTLLLGRSGAVLKFAVHARTTLKASISIFRLEN